MKYPFKKELRKIHRKLSLIFGVNRVQRFSAFVKLLIFQSRNIFFRAECYITCTGKMDGAGAQALAIMSTMLFAEKMGFKYIHTPFVKLQHNYENDEDWEKKWELFFNLGKGELNVGDPRLKISREVALGESPFKIKKQANTLFVMRHCHDYADLFPDKYRWIKDRLVEKYLANTKSGYDLHYETKKLNIAVHIRRGDVNSNNQFNDKFTENIFLVDVLRRISETISFYRVEALICVYSEGQRADFKELEEFNPRFFLNISPFSTFHNLVCADVIVMSKSTFSYVAALLSRGIVFYESFRHQPMNGWIKINKLGEFDPSLFSRKLCQYLSERQRIIAS